MKQIFKYSITNAEQFVKLRGKLISVLNQRNVPVIYAYHDANEPERTYHVRVFGTGFPIPDEIVRDYQFLGTVPMYDGDLIWHIYIKAVCDEELEYEP